MCRMPLKKGDEVRSVCIFSDFLLYICTIILKEGNILSVVICYIRRAPPPDVSKP